MYCPNCGNQIPDNAAFCGNCGTKTGAAPIAPQPGVQPVVQPVMQQQAVQPAAPVNGVRKMHCPNCKSVNISISTESSVTGGLTTHHGSVSSTHMSNEHRNYWFCADCGTKFRNIQNLEEEIQKKKSYPTIYTVITLISLLITVVLISSAMSNPISGLFVGPFAIAGALSTIIFFCFIFSTKKKLNNMKKELAYLKENCFN